jgi:outer membrane protein OmpA-like peptidoglycan-associated protein
MKPTARAAYLLLVVAAFGCRAQASVTTEPAPPPPPPPATVAQPAPEPPLPDYITIREQIQFETNKAVLLPQSFPILDEVAKVMIDNPRIELIEIGGHTDGDGDENDNLLLSQARCETVRSYLVTKGVALSRMLARGYGERVPLADNSTEEGKFRNRRVEFRIMKQPKR